MKKILCMLMPYGGHFYPNLELLRLFAQRGAQVVVYCDAKYQECFPDGDIQVRDYPTAIREYCGHMASAQTDRKRAAREYFSYMADARIYALMQIEDLTMNRMVVEALGAEVAEFAPDVFFYDAQATFLAQLREQIDCPQFELNASTFVPELWRSQRFQQYYQEILWTSYPDSISFDQILSLQRKRARRDKRPPDRSFGYLSPLLQDEAERLPATDQMLGFHLELHPQAQRAGLYVSRGTVCESYGAFLLEETVQALAPCGEPIHVSWGGNPYSEQVLTQAEFPENVHLHAYTNQTKMLENSKVFVTHGGIIGVREALFAHTPMLVIPANFPDYQVGQAIEAHHAGILIRNRPLDGEELRERYEALNRHYADYQAGAAAMAAELESYWNAYGAELVWKACELA